jgi:gas vesicle protein
MKKSELKASIREEIIEILSEVDAEQLATARAYKKGDSISKLASKLQQTTKEMKQVVKKWKNSEGEEKEKLTNRLRELTKIKKELEGLL